MARASAVAASDPKTVLYEIITDRLVVRCWEEQDAEILKEAIDSSIEHLRQWMPWARHEPEPVEKKRERIVQWRDKFLCQQREFAFGIFTRDERRLVGTCSIKFRGDPAVACLGYWLRADQVGQGYATEAIGALTLVVFHVLRVPAAEIFCDPRNARSAAIPRRLGFTRLDGEQSRRLTTGEDRMSQIWHLHASDMAASSIASRHVIVTNLFGQALCPPLA